MTARAAPPERITWAVQQLAPAPKERILEVGCGGGHALALMAAHAPVRALLGIDRSATQVQRARDRLRDLPAAVRPRVEPLTLAAAAGRWAATPFDAVLAINVNAFWVTPDASLRALAALLAPGGRALLVYEPPTAERARALAAKLGASVAASGLAVRDVREDAFARSRAIAIALGIAPRRARTTRGCR